MHHNGSHFLATCYYYINYHGSEYIRLQQSTQKLLFSSADAVATGCVIVKFSSRTVFYVVMMFYVDTDRKLARD